MKTRGPIKASRDYCGVMLRNQRFIKTFLVVGALFGVLATSTSVHAETLISQSFTSTGDVTSGSIVSLEKDSSSQVNPSTTANSNYMLGVIIDSENSQLSISSDQSDQVQVATSGVEQVLVSNINGNIAVGDPITASPISGIGMKATGNVRIIGLSQDVFPNATASSQSITESGQKQTVKLGEIPVLINVAYYYKQPNKTLIPSAIQNVANALAGKQVSSLPILVSVGIFFVTLILVVSIIYSMIRSSIISIGRNPMAQAAVYRNVLHLSVLVFAIIMTGIVSIYLTLTKL